VVQKGTATTLAEGLKLEARAFGELAVTDVSRALVTVFFATQDIKKDAGYPEGTVPRPVDKLGVLGAGWTSRRRWTWCPSPPTTPASAAPTWSSRPCSRTWT
jgi:hypothetical protein